MPEAFTSESLRLAPSRVEVDARVLAGQLGPELLRGLRGIFLDAAPEAEQRHERRDGHYHGHPVEHVAGGGGEVLADERRDRGDVAVAVAALQLGDLGR